MHHAVAFRVPQPGEKGVQQGAAADEPASAVFGQVCAAGLPFSMNHH